MRIERELVRGVGPVAVLKLLESLTKKGLARLHSNERQWGRLVVVMRDLGLVRPASEGADGR